jgi:hypothetical protein
MEEILKNIPQITLIVGGLFGFFQWLDQRKREREEKQYQSFHKMVCLAAGTDESGRTIKMAQQVAAIYQLQRYKQYAFASAPVIQLILHEMSEENNPGLEHLTKALNVTLEKLSWHD